MEYREIIGGYSIEIEAIVGGNASYDVVDVRAYRNGRLIWSNKEYYYYHIGRDCTYGEICRYVYREVLRYLDFSVIQ